MDVRIGVTDTAKELEIELPDDADRDAIMKSVTAALDGKTAVLWLEDSKGKNLGIPAAKIAYVEVGSNSSDRHIGFN